ncbi:ABC transporter permease subunit [Thermaerobacter composti]|uniref:ABC transporter permease subunit n=1 Tax=Thermaerobacter composti TaxID=554949 RepID=A0ABZ0QQG8_9FIRM|nr:ABC transporter permease subunit [Thermaerobacter composti]WPD18635.1 ABC transporter permease subunit [Thermaerobacter composti]
MNGSEPVTEGVSGAAAPPAPRPARPARGLAGWMARQARAVLRPTPFNPLIELELRARMRRGRTVLLLLGFTGALGALLLIALILTGGVGAGIYGPSPFEVSYSLFQAAMVAELVLVGAVAAATAAGGISGERERQTWEVLLTTRLPAWRIVSGKLVTAVLLVLWLVVASLPVFLPLFRFGAVSPATLARILGLLLASGLAWAAIGLFFSALFRRTIVAVIASYATAVAWVILTAVARPLQAALLGPRQFPGPGAATTQPVGPYLIELMNPLLVLLRTLSSPVVGIMDWMFTGGIPNPSARLTLGARVARALGEHGYYWVYILSALALTLVLAAVTTRLVARRRV